MNHLIPTTLLAGILLLPRASHAQEAEYLQGDILVMLAPGADVKGIAEDLATHNGFATHLSVVRELSKPMRTWLLHYENPAIAQTVMLRAVERHRAVMLAQNNHVVHERAVPNDANYGQQWQHDNIDSELAWDITTGGLTATGDTIVVAIMENADLPHADLVANAWHNYMEVPNNGVDDDGNGYIDDFDGWNTAGNNDNVYSGSHGTSVAGMIGAHGNNSIGVAGANWNVKMMPVTYGSLTDAAVMEVYTYPLTMRQLYNQSGGNSGAFVVVTNASWGIDGADHTDFPLWCAIYDSLGTEGVLNCGATANNNVDIDVVDDMPTGCESDFMISVTATNTSDMRTFSGYGATTIDVGAPGENIYTTQIGGGYGFTSGTSFASPLTAGVIALLYSAPCASLMDLVHSDPMAGALYVREALFEGVEQVGNLPGNTVTGGRINSHHSLQYILDNCGACPGATGLAATNPAIGASDLSWNSSSPGPFNLRYRTNGLGAWTTIGSVFSPFNITALDACTEYEFQVEVVCDTTTSGWSASYVWTSEGCCVPPDDLTLGFYGDNTVNVFWTPVLAATAYDLQISEAGSGIWTTVPLVSNSYYEFSGLTACTTYEIQVRTECGGTPTSWGPVLTVTTMGCGACLDQTYCVSVSDNASEEWIAGVQLGTLNNVSGSDDGYGDYTGNSTDLTINVTTPITLTPGFAGSTFDEWFTVWMDLDQDGAFTTTGEKVYDAGGTTTTAITGNITVPVGTPTGITRMRVIMVYDAVATSGCEDAYDYGETEDYCVNIVEGGSGIAGPAPTISGSVFPDPADRDVFFDLIGVSGPLTIELLDNTGRVAARKTVEHGRATLTTAWLNDGLYVWRVLQSGTELQRGKLMVAH